MTSSPPGAQVVARRFEPLQRLLAPGERIELGDTPTVDVRLPAGSWLVELRSAGSPDVRCPVMLRRGSHATASVSFRSAAEIGEGFVYIPKGRITVGGDVEAYDSLPSQEIDVDDFAIGRDPVTFREYCTFLDELQLTDPAMALHRAPREMRSAGGEGMIVVRGAEA